MKQEHKDFFSNRLVDLFAGCKTLSIQIYPNDYNPPRLYFNQQIVKAHFRSEGDDEEAGLEMTNGKIFFAKTWLYPQLDEQITLSALGSEYRLVWIVTNESEVPGLRDRVIQYCVDAMRMSGNELGEIEEYVSRFKNTTAGS